MVKYTFNAELLKQPLEDFFQPKELRKLPHTHEFKVWLNMMLATRRTENQHNKPKVGRKSA